MKYVRRPVYLKDTNISQLLVECKLFVVLVLSTPLYLFVQLVCEFFFFFQNTFFFTVHLSCPELTSHYLCSKDILPIGYCFPTLYAFDISYIYCSVRPIWYYHSIDIAPQLLLYNNYSDYCSITTTPQLLHNYSITTQLY